MFWFARSHLDCINSLAQSQTPFLEILIFSRPLVVCGRIEDLLHSRLDKLAILAAICLARLGGIFVAATV